jgi:hypothetical protein
LSCDQGGAASGGTGASFGELVGALGALAGRMLASDQPGALPGAADVTALMATAVRVYAAAAERAPDAPVPAQLDLTPTEACTGAAALLKSQLLTPFEFAIWFSGAGQEGA